MSTEYPSPRTRGQAARLYAHIEETEGRAAADEADARWAQDQEWLEDRKADAAARRGGKAHDDLADWAPGELVEAFGK